MPIRPITITTSSGTKNRWQVDYVDQAGKRRRNNSSRTKQAAEAAFIEGSAARSTAASIPRPAPPCWSAAAGDAMAGDRPRRRAGAAVPRSTSASAILRYHFLPLIGA